MKPIKLDPKFMEAARKASRDRKPLLLSKKPKIKKVRRLEV